MFCTACGTQKPEGNAQFCASCGASYLAGNAVPAGVAGWSWGAFLLNWIWAAGNRTWVGLFAMIPYIGFGVAIWLGIKGREMAWENARWDNVEHFNRVQRRWSQWGIGVAIFSGVISMLITILLFSYLTTAKENDVAPFSKELLSAIEENAESPDAVSEQEEPCPTDSDEQ